MDHLETAREILDTMLGYLGFAASVEIDRDTSTLNVVSGNAKLLIGHHGDRLEEIQYLVNRLVQDRIPDAPKVRVDIDNYLASREYRMIEEAESAAARVLATGQAVKLEPMNSYQRRLIHNHFKDHPEVKTWSPKDSARLKRVSILPKNSAESTDNASLGGK